MIIMKKFILIISLFISVLSLAQVGIGTTNPYNTSILDLSASNKALLLPRVANTAAVAVPVNGMMIYDMSSNCVKSYENSVWTGCLSATETNTVSNGLTFTRTAGTYATSGNIIYNFSGIFTGVTNTTFTINVDGFAGACSFVIFDAIRGALADGGCASCVAYDAAAINAPVKITKAEYDKIVLISGASVSGMSDAVIATNSANPQSFGGNVTFSGNSVTNVRIPASNFVMAYQVRTWTSTAPANMNGIQLKTNNTALTGSYVDYGTTTASTTGGNGLHYFVFKRPTQTTASGSDSFFAFFQTITGQIQSFNNGGIGDIANASGNTNTLSSNPTKFTIYAQFLTTPTRQW